MPLGPLAQKRLALDAANPAPPSGSVPIETMRDEFNGRPRLPGPDVATVGDRRIAISDGEITVRVYTPDAAGPLPAVVWMHGGGWVLGNLDSTDATCREIANQAGAVVISVDYRLAPETKFPGPVEDTYAALTWVTENAGSLGVDVQRLAIGGMSAGGNLASAASLMARDRGGPGLLHQVLIYPVLGYDFDTDSYLRNREGFGLSKATMVWYWEQYLGDPADAANPYAAPLSSTSLKGLPPALVITAEFDPLLDEGEAYATRLSGDGVPTTYSMYEGAIHGFFNSSAPLDGTWEAIAEASNALKAAFA